MNMKSCYRSLRGTSPFVVYMFQSLFFKYIYASFYAFFAQYLNVQGHQFLSMNNLLRNAWSMKCFFSFISDSFPICGLRRLPYVAAGLTIIFICKIIMFALPMPEPYFESTYDIANGTCSRDETVILNPDAANSALVYSILFGIAYSCMALSDCCIDGLLTQRSMLEEEKTRGKLLTSIKITEKITAALFAILFAVFYNKVDYGGSFCFGLEFNQLSLVAAIFFYTIFFTNERDYDVKCNEVGFRDNLKNIWIFLQTSHFLKLLGYRAFVSTLFGFSTPAKTKVETRWVRVEPLIKGYQSVAINLLAALGMWFFRKYFINSNWRKMIVYVTFLEVVLRAVTELLALFGILRNQYFWYADDLVYGFFYNWIFFTSSLIVIEYAPKNLEGTSFAVLWAVASCSGAIGTALGNIVYSFFDVVNDVRYMRDTTDDRLAVFYTFLIDWCMSLSTVFFVFLLPKQKPMAREWRKQGEQQKHRKTAIFLLLFVSFGFGISLVLSCLTLFESTRCLIVAGGPGCNVEPEESVG
ncbi:uncharacterized protein LOC142350906 isoform X2 [Convolutriloba macropyga]|uniref:uncharacterized protein LOC142350906 isoform X2 n=1 Tax=Convolutriloba macropyga TaxID=536237 RepID=UPI003F5205C4